MMIRVLYCIGARANERYDRHDRAWLDTKLPGKGVG